jgi:hypothetical protein
MIAIKMKLDGPLVVDSKETRRRTAKHRDRYWITSDKERYRQ